MPQHVVEGAFLHESILKNPVNLQPRVKAGVFVRIPQQLLDEVLCIANAPPPVEHVGC